MYLYALLKISFNLNVPIITLSVVKSTAEKEHTT
jgi:hypothetical protein